MSMIGSSCDCQCDRCQGVEWKSTPAKLTAKEIKQSQKRLKEIAKGFKNNLEGIIAKAFILNDKNL